MQSARFPCVHISSHRGTPYRPYLSLRCRAEKKSSFSDSSLSSRLSKGLVSGLTAIVNSVSGSQAVTREPQTPEQQPVEDALTPEEVLDGVSSATGVVFITPE
jgi:hypothetical protein